VKWPIANTMMIPALIVANGEDFGESVWPMLTVVPLLEAPTFQRAHEENPVVSLKDCPSEDGSTRKWSAFTQLLLSVSLSERVSWESGSFNSWVADLEETQSVIRDVLDWME